MKRFYSYLLACSLTLGCTFSYGQIHMPPAGLTAYWSANGNAADSVGGHNGTLHGNVSYVPGVSGQAFSFIPPGSRVRISDAPAFATPSFTVSGWVYARSWGGHLLVRGDGRPGLDTYTLGLYDTGNLSFGIISAAHEYDNVLAPLQLNTWTHFAATFDDASSTMRLYVNGMALGQKITSVKPIVNLDPSYSPGIGIGNVNELWNDFNLNGMADEIAIFSRALSPSEVASMVPEPTAAALLCLGVIGFIIQRKNR